MGQAEFTGYFIFITFRMNVMKNNPALPEKNKLDTKSGVA